MLVWHFNKEIVRIKQATIKYLSQQLTSRPAKGKLWSSRRIRRDIINLSLLTNGLNLFKKPLPSLETDPTNYIKCTMMMLHLPANFSFRILFHGSRNWILTVHRLNILYVRFLWSTWPFCNSLLWYSIRHLQHLLFVWPFPPSQGNGREDTVPSNLYFATLIPRRRVRNCQ